jgi:hypothetical protein
MELFVFCRFCRVIMTLLGGVLKRYSPTTLLLRSLQVGVR